MSDNKLRSGAADAVQVRMTRTLISANGTGTLPTLAFVTLLAVGLHAATGAPAANTEVPNYPEHTKSAKLQEPATTASSKRVVITSSGSNSAAKKAAQVKPAAKTNSKAQPPKAVAKVANPHNFNYTLKPVANVCAKSANLLALVVVHSAPTHFFRRNFIRRTWGSHEMYDKLRIAVVFTLGQPAGGEIDVKYGNDTEKVQMLVKRESDKFGDILQENFLDTYRNLTYKAVMWLQWITHECPEPKWIVKVDDDVLVNSFSLSSHLRHMDKHEYANHNTISCLVWSGVKVIRNKKSKWYVSPEEYPNKWYPPYCSGSAYIFSADLAPRLYKASMEVPFFWVDDFYVTGALAKKVGAKFHQMGTLYAVTEMPSDEIERRITHAYAIFAHVPAMSIPRRGELWRQVKKLCANHKDWLKDDLISDKTLRDLRSLGPPLFMSPPHLHN